MNTYPIGQMELSLNGRSRRTGRPDRRQRRQRAQWWFAQMRRVVETAMEWRPEPGGRPSQDCLALAAKRP
jgi:hypothetical protein